MKKILSLGLIMIICLTLVGCGNSKTSNDIKELKINEVKCFLQP